MNTVEDQNENRQNGNLNREVFAGDPMHFASGLPQFSREILLLGKKRLYVPESEVILRR